jgi:hypothetical protein
VTRLCCRTGGTSPKTNVPRGVCNVSQEEQRGL